MDWTAEYTKGRIDGFHAARLGLNAREKALEMVLNTKPHLSPERAVEDAKIFEKYLNGEQPKEGN